MTIDDSDIDDTSFRGVMESLNLDQSTFKNYSTSTFQNLSFSELSQIKTDIESQLNLLFELLKSKYGADMDTPLTIDGFPRDDIDVVTIRLIRIKIIRLRNDDKLILNLLEAKMQEEFERRKAEGGNEEVEEQERRAVYNIPYALVKEVVSGGPAFKSGLKEGDQVILFDGRIHASNHNRLLNLVDIVKSKKGDEIEVDIKRNEERLKIILVPTDDWDGQGLLGCRLIPI
ncbi:unnamed protein product [Candida verbasci]|uniref:Probable 26S proteasome regulatory subunit p27 n=1 Tax=Candida verbasci TaxID=1227364 RepID=A0A9W4TSA0_9ASCO|nr:unnamed protein product [Candida verbasci]